MRKLAFSFPVWSIFFFWQPLQAASGPEDHSRLDMLLEMNLEELVELEVSIATRNPIALRKAPATATVISGTDIRNMGARNLVDVLQRVPGFGITRGYFSLYELEVRGLKTDRSEKIKLMVNGHSLNYPVWGGAAWAYDTISLDQVDHIEIVRGPGSALYGANAFSGIINVVTKAGSDVNGNLASAGIGSDNRQKYHLAHGKRYGNLDLLIYSTYTDTDGDRLRVDGDLVGQSGHTDDWARSIDLAVKAAWHGFSFNAGMLKHDNGPYVGVQWTLNDDTEIETEQYFADLGYAAEINDRWNVNGRIYGDWIDIDLNWEIFPEGVPAAIGLAPLGWGPADSMLGTPAMENSRYGLELGASYKLRPDNTVTFGAVYEKVKHYDLTYHANFNPRTSEKLLSYQDITSWVNWGLPATREITAVYLQDEWEVLRDVNLIAGARYDHYSDFGDVTSPRIGLVWNVTSRAEFKLLYGEAFRAPNFEELYLINNPATRGNPDLQPEYMQTYEIAGGYRFGDHSKITVSGFYNVFEDRIDFVPIGGGAVEARNSGDATIKGVELEIQQKWGNFRPYATITWQRAEKDDTGERLPDIPSSRWNLGLDFAFAGRLQGNVHLLTVGDRPRAQGDPRSDLDSYTVADASLTLPNFPLPSLDVQLSLYNIFDTDYSYPAPAGTLTDDFPAPARTIFLETRYSF